MEMVAPALAGRDAAPPACEHEPGHLQRGQPDHHHHRGQPRPADDAQRRHGKAQEIAAAAAHEDARRRKVEGQKAQGRAHAAPAGSSATLNCGGSALKIMCTASTTQRIAVTPATSPLAPSSKLIVFIMPMNQKTVTARDEPPGKAIRAKEKAAAAKGVVDMLDEDEAHECR